MLDTPWARASSRTTCTHASVPIMRTSASRTTLAWMKMTSPVGTLPKPKPLSTNHLSTTSLTTLFLSARASGRLASRSSSSSWECSFSSRASLLTATSAFTSSFLSRRTRNSTIRRISCRSWVQSTIRSSSAVAWRCEPPASMSGATGSKSSACLSRVVFPVSILGLRGKLSLPGDSLRPDGDVLNP